MAQVILDGTLSKTQYEYKKNYPGQGGDIYFNTYQTYDRSIDQSGNIDVGTLKTYQLVRKNNNWYIGAELGVDGKWKAVTEKESKILVPNSDPTKPGSFSPIPNATDEKVLGDIVIADLNAGGRTSLRFQAITNSKKLLKKGGGLSDFQVDDEFQTSNNITGPAATPLNPQAPSLFGPPVSPSSPTPTTPQQTLQTTPLEIPEIEAEYNRDSYGPPLVYPKSIRKNKQDYIQFESFEYVGRRISPTATSSGGSPGIGDRNFSSTPKGTVILPVQPSISDVNTVQWGSGDLNAVGAFFASASYGAMSNPGTTIDAVIETLSRNFESNPNIGPGFKLWAAGRAASVSGLLSRVGGAVLNPNTELLFQGPQLRPFNFTFRLSARDENEAETIKKIIRFFKQNMSVKTTKDNIFLKTPNIFQITYNNGDGDTHTSLNRIKKCALTAFNVNYTPDSQYMTFKDSAKGYPMTSYGLSMQFQELEPVTEKDYEPLNDKEIGY